MTVKARYEDNVLKPLEKLDLDDGEMVEIEIIKSNADRLIGLLKDIDVDSVDLQHAARDIWVRQIGICEGPQDLAENHDSYAY
jgi:predicted DNA-binding antitoxin AbrB/MazE fold protein